MSLNCYSVIDGHVSVSLPFVVANDSLGLLPLSISYCSFLSELQTLACRGYRMNVDGRKKEQSPGVCRQTQRGSPLPSVTIRLVLFHVGLDQMLIPIQTRGPASVRTGEPI